MLIWINGAFGAGKTQVAHELQRRLGRAHVADPELIGYAIHKMLPPGSRDDFQDRPQWRAAVAETLRQADAEADSPVIVPMTMVDPVYFDETVGTLRDAGTDVRHVALVASPETLRRRLAGRVSSVLAAVLGRDETWATAQIDRCVTALADERFAVHIDTDERSLDEVVEAVAAAVDVELTAGRLGPVRSGARRLEVAARHIRL
ncbi:hypothetical protein GOARA_062_00630 [Gordonia araii NBRC 100433]|uniref:Uncharacterized protein n=1 Tax=Gordonia araii NBRC 100433 TaxID=1073574 RepID=G7H4M0_9ACTN|nr:AAA family ATPase [Gordonia araii]NNG96148.1 AAA family ATPase [Gordonia araii NBRC 100433]GAB10795.1 hypothetical protein GOARA_062_00630 [Gordonia araii NBRC 100433]